MPSPLTAHRCYRLKHSAQEQPANPVTWLPIKSSVRSILSVQLTNVVGHVFSPVAYLHTTSTLISLADNSEGSIPLDLGYPGIFRSHSVISMYFLQFTQILWSCNTKKTMQVPALHFALDFSVLHGEQISSLLLLTTPLVFQLKIGLENLQPLHLLEYRMWYTWAASSLRVWQPCQN